MKATVLLLLSCFVALSRAFTTSSPLRTTTASVRPYSLHRPEVRLAPSNQDFESNREEKQALSTPRTSKDPTPVLFQAIEPFLSMVQPSTVLAAAALVVALAMAPQDANAASSGGRMGGSFSSGGSRSGGYSRVAPSRSYSNRGYNNYNRPSISINPIITPFAASPFGFPSPFFYGGPGVITYSRGPNILDLMLFGGVSLFVFNAIRAASSQGTSNIVPWVGETVDSPLGVGTSVAQISVALEVPNRDDSNSILGVLQRLSRTAKTDSRVGIQNLTSQVALELLRRKSSIVSVSTQYNHFNDRSRAQREFNALSVKERAKFESETVSQYGGVEYSQGFSRGGSTDSKATMAVVTIMINIDGDSTKLPKIRSMADVEDALRKIASDVKVSDCLQGAEILWTPEDRSETLTMREVVADYPELTSV